VSAVRGWVLFQRIPGHYVHGVRVARILRQQHGLHHMLPLPGRQFLQRHHRVALRVEQLFQQQLWWRMSALSG